ncbi:MAG TPA: hypothetical protein VNF74_07375 [Terriglobales bacterium]|nr:hypothetical protein [Terriglobales bacterium]
MSFRRRLRHQPQGEDQRGGHDQGLPGEGKSLFHPILSFAAMGRD